MTNGADSTRFDNLLAVREGRLILFLCTFFLFLVPHAFSQVIAQTDTTVAGIKSLYDNGSYISAELLARRMLEEKNLSDSVRVQLEKYVAFSLVAQGQNDAAADHFKNALKIDSAFALDPVLTSPKILVVFEAAKNQYEIELAKRQSQVLKDASGGGEFSEQWRGGPTFRAILFPGWEQSFRGEPVKGHILLGAGTATAVSSIAFYFLQRNARSSYLDAPTPDLAASRYKTYDSFYKAQFYSVSAFVLIYVYSGIDAFVKLPPYFDLEYSTSQPSVKLSLQIHF
jgi:hypothetical protein